MIIKVCGMRDPENIHYVEALRVDWIGFIFYPQSSRYVPDQSPYIDAIRRCTKSKVGVFVNDTIDNILSKAETYRLDYLQLHGQETPEYCLALRRQRGYSIVKALSVASEADLQLAQHYTDSVDYLLFDTKCAGYGGSGRRFDWTLLDLYQSDVPFLLSGGLSPGCENDIYSLKRPQFVGIDLNSGFELSPAVKDIAKLERFIDQIRMI